MYVITGATGNTGKVVAETLLAISEKVRVLGRSAEKLQPFVAKSAEAFVADVTDESEVERLFQEAVQAFGTVDVLVNNAGFGIFHAAEKLSERDIRSVMETNFFGAVFLTQRVL
ncbi:MAG: SDR family oxidoreductase, partial [Acidobacteria bacterium]|nr:SDR family oxidoreductase [Acidobacteriota bacterium]